VEQAGLGVIVGRVKSENDLAMLRVHGVGYAQGDLFGGPRKVRSDILAAA
jgi:EAL domain-containing protein (putative c-di-GMP-specific phosphodiesterase class I)